MPRLNLWKPYKSNDYDFIDQAMSDNIRIGGVGVLIHKYIGPTEDGDVLDIDDVLFLENRNRFYEENLLEMKCVYQPQDVDYDLTQFGIFLSSDTIRIDFHYNDMIDSIGRKLISGDVLEFPNQRDTSLDGVSINKYYVIQDALYSASGYGQDWYPHMWKIRAKQMPAAPEYDDIINKASTGDSAGGEGEGTGLMPPGYTDMIDENGNPGPGCDVRIKNSFTSYCKLLNITEENVKEAAANAFYDPRFFETPHLYVHINNDGYPELQPYFTGDGIPPNGAPLKGFGTSFPDDMLDGEYFLRIDYDPDRLFQKQGSCYVRIEDDLRKYWTPYNKILDTYIDNVEITTREDGSKIREKQPLSKVIPQREDQYAEHREDTVKNEQKRQRIAKKLDNSE